MVSQDLLREVISWKLSETYIFLSLFNTSEVTFRIRFSLFAENAQNVTIHALKRLSRLTSAWHFRKSSPKHHISHSKTHWFSAARAGIAKSENTHKHCRFFDHFESRKVTFLRKSKRSYVFKQKEPATVGIKSSPRKTMTLWWWPWSNSMIRAC